MGSTPPRTVVSWEGPGEPIMLTVYGPDGTTAVPLLPKRALTLAQELLTRARPRTPRAAAGAGFGGGGAMMVATAENAICVEDGV